LLELFFLRFAPPAEEVVGDDMMMVYDL
jgi:hypothetical protein